MSKSSEEWEKEKAAFGEKMKKERQQVNEYLKRDLENPVIYTHSVTLVDKYYWQKVALGLMLWLSIALLDGNALIQGAFLVVYIYKFL